MENNDLEIGQPNEALDPRLEEMLKNYAEETHDQFREEWRGYSEDEKERIYQEFIKQHGQAAA